MSFTEKFRCATIVDAIRLYLWRFRLPGEVGV